MNAYRWSGHPSIGRVIALAQGDSICFDASLGHRGKSVGGKAQALVVIYTP